MLRQAAFLRVPPFPGHRAGALLGPGDGVPRAELGPLAAALARWRVGGAFWHPAHDPWYDNVRGAEADLARALAAGGGHDALAAALAGYAPRDPFTGASMGWVAAARLLADWRALIDGNRRIGAVLGVARWKRAMVDPLLWDGGGPVRHRRRVGDMAGDQVALCWVARTGGAALAAAGGRLAEIEDGYVRSAGLGADCVPPLSVIVDFGGNPVDPARVSDLEARLLTGPVEAAARGRARALRSALVAGGIGKYGAGGGGVDLPPRDGRRRVLVAGQVGDDRAMALGGAGVDNRALLLRARAAEPGAEIWFKPHPDVLAGHRRGAVADAAALADRVLGDEPMAAVLAAVDGVHVVSSLTGFEALLRGCDVTTHGVPFYAGWGLTRDLGPVPGRRLNAARLCVDDLVAHVLVDYARYVDPVTRLPCPAEVVVARLAQGRSVPGGMAAALIAARRWQGRARRWFGTPMAWAAQSG
ncbi:beta-3-deoxy-D-manno-oct-2-ulosonic acid transferase [Novosphingobium sp. FSY-8]|uniref:Beta-3-deoxy-D-manno-oct-2-ulosonic acid transferase n=1 Tax=Novosphingobium ovatum TaxID=1908523 RepID=A0ABW9XED7_9SPHN|nr:beta-3-deoxy-D-manno-oct-2-ulosonic acid transferase [Novosphingobium ovatum]NBC36909.1 beta-3-deoxy-D-manno-oct-2-ulosonic acid transferase [Novosphingobium ovatum]